MEHALFCYEVMVLTRSSASYPNHSGEDFFVFILISLVPPPIPCDNLGAKKINGFCCSAEVVFMLEMFEDHRKFLKY